MASGAKSWPEQQPCAECEQRVLRVVRSGHGEAHDAQLDAIRDTVNVEDEPSTTRSVGVQIGVAGESGRQTP